MEGNSWRPAPVGSSADWRSQLQPKARQRIVNKIMQTLTRHLPISVPEGLTELLKIAIRFEEKIYAAASNQSDYLRKISLKLLSMENKSQHSGSINPSTSNSTVLNQNPADSGTLFAGFDDYDEINWSALRDVSSLDWRTQLEPEARQRVVYKIMETLKRALPISLPEGLNEIQKIAIRFEEKIYTTADNQSDYLRKISLKMLSVENKSWHSASINNQNPADPGTLFAGFDD